ncbi:MULTISPECIES: hypothetical protein [Bacillaceae]|uniref:Uncharacterized protein n=1 Tax=Evansella alkalicola TaxID=745819 RepID=A0ABS6K108_9BACI|nr:MULTISPECIES: hypothetical protein [Bacillaceae]MBU9723614.1 hypothetical protein [Bacillus alkalicola]
MGYIPPVRDEQTMIYGYRHHLENKKSFSTPPLHPIVFNDSLKGLPNSKGNLELEFEQVNKMKEMQLGRIYENKLSGKGHYVDEII